MGLFFYNKIDSIIPIVVLPTTEIIEPEKFQPGENPPVLSFSFPQLSPPSDELALQPNFRYDSKDCIINNE